MPCSSKHSFFNDKSDSREMSWEYRKRYDPSFGFVTLALANAMRGKKKKRKIIESGEKSHDNDGLAFITRLTNLSVHFKAMSINRRLFYNDVNILRSTTSSNYTLQTQINSCLPCASCLKFCSCLKNIYTYSFIFFFLLSLWRLKLTVLRTDFMTRNSWFIWIFIKSFTKIGFAVGMTYGHLNLFQTEIDIAQVESVQRNQAEMEGQD